MQFLNPNDRDITAISFEEKLSKFLNSVLVSDKLTKQIRMAFDAYIFISYRKKDRNYANVLMKLIHDNDFCQSIATWYDEFLVPGENFNDAIKEALEKSQLFALVVTPNLVNEENYVKSIEYPMAIEAGKPILPAEMESVNHKKLAEDYPAIPDCLSPSKLETISALLMQSLAHIAKTHHENEPQHNFFMGLAYLNGIDVEVSHDRALLLIRSAADAGLPEAVKKLSDMYFYGDGIERNTEKALSLQEKLTTLLCDAYESEPEEESALVYLDALYEYSCNLYRYGQIQEAMLKKNKVVTTAMKMSADFQSLKVLKYYVDACLSIGNILENDIQKSKAAENYFKECLKVSKFIDQSFHTEETRIRLASCHKHIGRMYQERWMRNKAEANFLTAIMLYGELETEFPSLERREDLAEIYEMIGDLYSQMNHLKKAEEFLNRALTIAEQNYAENHRKINILIMVLRTFGVLENQKKSYQKAYEYFERMCLLASNELEITGSVQSRTTVSIACTYLGRSAEFMGQDDEALHHYEQALAMAEEVYHINDYASYAYDVAVCLEDIGLLYKKYITFDRNVVQNVLHSGKINDNAIERSFQNREYAQKYLLRALDIRLVLRENTDTPQTRLGLFRVYQNLAQLSMNYHDKKYYYTGYMNACRNFVDYLNKESSENSRRYQKKLLEAFDELYKFGADTGDSLFACSNAEHALELNKELMPTPKTLTEIKNLAIRYHRAAESCCFMHYWVRAREYYKEELQLRSKIVCETGDEKDYEILFSVMYALSQIPYEDKAWLTNLKQIYNYCKKLEQKFSESERFTNLKNKAYVSFELMAELLISEYSFEPENMVFADKLLEEAMKLRLKGDYELSRREMKEYFKVYQDITLKTGSLCMLTALRQDYKNSILICEKLREDEWKTLLLRELLKTDKVIAMKTGFTSAFQNVKDDYLNCIIEDISSMKSFYWEGYLFFEQAFATYPNNKNLSEIMQYFEKHSR